MLIFITIIEVIEPKKVTARYTLEDLRGTVLADFDTRKAAVINLHAIERVTGKRHRVMGHREGQTWQSA